MCCKIVDEKEKERDELLEEIKELEEELVRRKNECKFNLF